MTQHAETEPVATVVTSEPDPIASEAAPTVEGSRGVAWEEHPVNIRLSLPLVSTRYYLTIVAGKERRSAARRVSERRKHPLDTFGNILLMVVIGCVLGLALYGLQMTLGLWALERFIVVP